MLSLISVCLWVAGDLSLSEYVLSFTPLYIVKLGLNRIWIAEYVYEITGILALF